MSPFLAFGVVVVISFSFLLNFSASRRRWKTFWAAQNDRMCHSAALDAASRQRLLLQREAPATHRRSPKRRAKRKDSGSSVQFVYLFMYYLYLYSLHSCVSVRSYHTLIHSTGGASVRLLVLLVYARIICAADYHCRVFSQAAQWSPASVVFQREQQCWHPP